MPPKPTEQVKGSGAEWYNIDFDPEILRQGAVVAASQVIKGQSVQNKIIHFQNFLNYTNFSLCRSLHKTEGKKLLHTV